MIFLFIHLLQIYFSSVYNILCCLNTSLSLLLQSFIKTKLFRVLTKTHNYIEEKMFLKKIF